jgi:hypothetical protein
LGRTLIWGLALYTLFGLLIPLARGPVLVATAMLMAAQLFGDCLRTIYFVNETSLRQAMVPDRLLGRVTASTELLSAGLGPLGALLGGLLGQAIGVRPTLLIATLCSGGIAVVWLLASPIRRMETYPESGEHGA